MRAFFLRALFALLVILGTAALPARAAVNIGGTLGTTIPSGDAFTGTKLGALFGLEGTLSLMDVVEMGAFYDANIIGLENPTLSGGQLTNTMGLKFYGGLVRMSLPFSGFFGEVKLGWDKMSVGGLSSNAAFGFGLGAGYRFDLGLFKLGPRLSYRNLKNEAPGTSLSGSTIDIAVLFQLGF